MRHPIRIARTWGLFGALLCAACADAPTHPAPEARLSVTSLVLAVWPVSVELASGDVQEFSSYLCPPDANGDPQFGPDGVPGTSDDDCFPVTAAWTVEGDIGTISTTLGATTTLTAALPDGSSLEAGLVSASITGQVAVADVLVVGSDSEAQPIGAGELCVQLTSNGANVGKKVCRSTTRVTFGFDAGKGAQATFTDLVDRKDGEGDLVDDAPAAAIGLVVQFVPTGTAVLGLWKKGRIANEKIGHKDPEKLDKVRRARKVDLEFTDADGVVTSMVFGSMDVIDLAPFREMAPGGVIDDAHVTYELGGSSSGSGE